ncbi:hypothetical protein [Mycobacterium sp.]|uniref:hypothetical protein n=1 Tax=Mycobacterium sp. TaxID=1785 RepID=UPI003F97A76B
MSTWYRLACDRHTPPVHICDIEHDEKKTRATQYEMFAALRERIGASTPIRRDASGEISVYNTNGSILANGVRATTGRAAVTETRLADGRRWEFTCLVCKAVARRKKNNVRASDATLALVLRRIGATLRTRDVELQEEHAEGWQTHRLGIRLLPLDQLSDEVTANPRGASTNKR